ncbi:MAG: flagellar biosynthesis protein FliQ [Spirochaetes bacterium]|nr:flagellar biosynthesis protein FliQ [Spirochaetota bacterium]
MSQAEIMRLVSDTLWVFLYVSAPILGVSVVVGLVVSVIQATTSIQEQTLTFVPKIIAIAAVLIGMGGWMFSMLTQFTINLFNKLPSLAR